MEKTVISVVTAAFNEEEALPLFFEKMTEVLGKHGESYEIIAVNDGSSDGTERVLREACERDKRIVGINLSRNFGQQAALLAGLKEAKGDAIIIMDADLQDPPEVAIEMIKKWREGAEVVHAKRRSRPGDGFFKKETARIYYRFLKRISHPSIPENVGDYKLYSRRAADQVLALPERMRYLKGESVWIGFKQEFVEFDRPKREKGETKYSFKKLLKLAFDGAVSNGSYPLTLSAKAGLALCTLSGICFVTFAVLAICKIVLPLAAWLFPTVALIGGIDMAFKGFSDAYIGKIYNEVKNRPVYIIKDKLNAKE